MSNENWIEEQLGTLGEDIEISEYGRSYLDEAYERAMMQDKAKPVWKSAIKAAGITLLITGGLATVGVLNPALAQNIPALHQVFEEIHDSLFQNTPYEPYAEAVNLVAEDQGFRISIDEVVCDNKKLGYTYTIKSEEQKLRVTDLHYESVYFPADVYIDGKEIKTYSAIGGGEFVDDYTYRGDSVIEFDERLPEEFDFRLEIKHLIGEEEQWRADGLWSFQSPITMKTSEYHTVVAPRGKWKIGNGEVDLSVKVREVILSPIDTNIALTVGGTLKLEEVLSQYDIRWALVDSDGNGYLMKDSSGSLGGALGLNWEGYKVDINYSSIGAEEIPEWIGLVPSIGVQSQDFRETKVPYDGVNLPTIKRDGFGDVIIKEIIQEGDDVRVTVKYGPLQGFGGFALTVDGEGKGYYQEVIKESDLAEYTIRDTRIEDIEEFVISDLDEEWLVEQMIKIPIQ